MWLRQTTATNGIGYISCNKPRDAWVFLYRSGPMSPRRQGTIIQSCSSFWFFFWGGVQQSRSCDATGSKEGNVVFYMDFSQPTFSQVYLSKKWQFSSQRRDKSYCSCSECVKTPLCWCIPVSDITEEKKTSFYICKTNLLTLWEKTPCEHKSDILKKLLLLLSSKYQSYINNISIHSQLCLCPPDEYKCNLSSLICFVFFSSKSSEKYAWLFSC